MKASSTVLPRRRHHWPFLALGVLLGGVALVSLPNSGLAQKKGAGTAQAPTIAMPLPMGMQRGSTLDLTITGANLADPVAVVSSVPGLKVTIPPENNNGKDNAKLRVLLEAPNDAPLGTHTLRVVSPRGVSNLRLFCIDDLPQTVGAGSNKTRETAQEVPVPGVVAGRIDAETTHYYKIKAAAGQRLSFDLLGRRLGSAFDPQLAIVDPRNRREIAFSNDAPGLQTDACLTHTFKDAGEYLIELRDVMYRGGADFAYRLRIGDFPCATTPLPMAAKRGSKVSVSFAGPNVEGVAPVEVQLPSDPGVNTVWVAPRGASGLHGTPVALAVSDLDEVLEQEPNDEPGKATRVPAPGGVTARFHQKGDVDHFVFGLKKGEKVAIEAQTLELYSPTEVYLVLKDAKGADVAKTNPQQAARIDYTPPADGDYTLRVEHLLYWGGPTESYHLTITPSQPGFDVALSADRIDIPQGSAGLLPIAAVTARDYKGPIELKIVGHPGLSGSKTIDSQAKAAQNQPLALMLVTANGDVPLGGFPIQVQARAMINGKEVIRQATVKPALSAALGGLPFPPRHLAEQVFVGITERPPFTLAAKFEAPEGIRGGKSVVVITAARAEGFDAEITLAPIGLPQNVTTTAKSIPKGQSEIKAELMAAKNAPLGEAPISFSGKAKHMNKEFNVIAPPQPFVLTLPFALKVEAMPFKITTGEKAKFKVIAERKGGYQGPITLEVRGLPTGLTTPKATIAAEQNEAEFEVSAAANAALGDKADVNVLGIATAAENQQNATPNFTVTVNKK